MKRPTTDLRNHRARWYAFVVLAAGVMWGLALLGLAGVLALVAVIPRADG